MKEEVEQFRTRVQLQDWTPTAAEAEEHSTQKAFFEVTAITAGIGNGWHFTQEALRASLGLWEGVEVFIDHQQPKTHRSLRDLAGVAYAARYDESCQGVVLKLKPSGPSAELLEQVGAEWLGSPSPRPRVGFSADIVFSASSKVVKQIIKVISLDLVYRPARGGAFNRVLQQQIQPMEEKMQNETAQLSETTESTTVESQLSLEVQQIKSNLLELKLKESNLPEPAQIQVRKQFESRPFGLEELDQAIQAQRELVAALQGRNGIRGAGRIEEMRSERDQLQAATDDLLGAPREASMQSARVARLSGIRELYLRMTGDVDFHGRMSAEHAQLADSDSLSNVLKNSFNKIMLQQWEQLGKAGYRWWEKVVKVEHMGSLQNVSGILLGEVSALGVISEGATYGELEISDSGESNAFRKYGGLLPITLEMIDKDETHKLRQLPQKLASSAIRNISSLVAGLFSSSSGTGPIMSDGAHVFDAIAHNNLGTTALSGSSFEAASQSIYQQSMISNDITKPMLAVDARYLLVPRALRLTARQILYPTFERESNIFSENMLRGELGDVITVPDWTDANDWAAMADPNLVPGIIIAERFGLMPEIFVAEQEVGFDMLHNDTINLKVRHFLSVFVADYRPLYKANVA
ncbi:MAG: hypothetical protein CVU41_12640 [Chloroflexi bacterium HGW-Chloroflexi-3]|nr:MAG: hypothetical protein CVU41_12640 [Chloroflexi bacterium HGW-Chloroflexi-3]